MFAGPALMRPLRRVGRSARALTQTRGLAAPASSTRRARAARPVAVRPGRLSAAEEA